MEAVVQVVVAEVLHLVLGPVSQPALVEREDQEPMQDQQPLLPKEQLSPKGFNHQVSMLLRLEVAVAQVVQVCRSQLAQHQ
ncbi:hypothetical protein RS9916_28309 [Synechococcus sp. RS9916]|nr:hypothetical protein RS9916_28309 [Synechococcus sp. RS9916]